MILVTSMVLSLVQGQNDSPAPSGGETPSKPDGQVTCDFNIEGSDPAVKQGLLLLFVPLVCCRLVPKKLNQFSLSHSLTLSHSLSLSPLSLSHTHTLSLSQNVLGI